MGEIGRKRARGRERERGRESESEIESYYTSELWFEPGPCRINIINRLHWIFQRERERERDYVRLGETER